MPDKEKRVRLAGSRGWDRARGVAGIGDAGILDLFSRVVTGRRRIRDLSRFLRFSCLVEG